MSFLPLKRLFDRYYKDFSENSKNSLYYLFSGTEYSFPEEWNKEILKNALSIIPEKFSDHAIFLSIDDTIIEKYGHEFEKCSEIFDRNKNAFVNGYCLLSIVITIVTKNYIGYTLSKVHLGFKTWMPQKKSQQK